MKTWRLFAQLFADAPRGRLALVLAFTVAAGAIEGIGLLLLVPLVQTLTGGQPAGGALARALALSGQPPGLASLLALFLLLMALRGAVQYGGEQLRARLFHQVGDQLGLRCLGAVLNAEWRWLANTRGADHGHLLLNEVNRAVGCLQLGLGLLASLVIVLAWLVAALVLSWTMTGLALLTGGLLLRLLSGQGQAALRLARDVSEDNRQLHEQVQQSLSGIKLSKILGTEQRHLQRYRQTCDRLRDHHLAFVAGSTRSRALFQLGGAALLALYLLAGVTWLAMPVAELLTMVLIFSRLMPQWLGLQQQWQQWQHALPAVERVQQLLADCQAMAEPAGEPADEAATAPGTGPTATAWPVRDAIRVSDLTLHHADRERPALDHLSLTLPARTTTAITGASGAGKSTLADVLMGLLSPDSGRLSVDGVEITGARRRAWRHHVAYVPQDTWLFHDSIRNNLLWARANAGDDALRQALQQAAADFVFQLPQGLDTVVGDGGIRLSGGERQRIALARALLGQPSLLILDEATSALDLDNEGRVRQAIEALHGDLTVVVIGHRLPTLEHADQVIVLDHGRIAAQGSWADVHRQQAARARA